MSAVTSAMKSNLMHNLHRIECCSSLILSLYIHSTALIILVYPSLLHSHAELTITCWTVVDTCQRFLSKGHLHTTISWSWWNEILVQRQEKLRQLEIRLSWMDSYTYAHTHLQRPHTNTHIYAHTYTYTCKLILPHTFTRMHQPSPPTYACTHDRKTEMLE